MNSLIRKFNAIFGADMAGPVIALIAVMLIFGTFADNFLSLATFGSVAFQLPELGLLTLAMLLPLLTGGSTCPSPSPPICRGSPQPGCCRPMAGWMRRRVHSCLPASPHSSPAEPPER